MQVTTSYKTKIIGYNHIFDDTLRIYRDALAYIIEVVDAEWDNIKDIKSPEYRQRFVERLIHRTKSNEPVYDFDDRFYKLPSYFRRGVISEKTAKAIVDYAGMHRSDVIVFEHLDMQGRKRGSKKQKLHLWRKKAVIAMVASKAHLRGMRISTVCAWGTSKLAFDGSGSVERGKYTQDGKEHYNYSICVFPTGKRYHCDLNASYNIGARYYIREILKSLPETDNRCMQ